MFTNWIALIQGLENQNFVANTQFTNLQEFPKVFNSVIGSKKAEEVFFIFDKYLPLRGLTIDKREQRPSKGQNMGSDQSVLLANAAMNFNTEREPDLAAAHGLIAIARGPASV